nr:MAG: DNA pilot protein [Microviridae sp.]
MGLLDSIIPIASGVSPLANIASTVITNAANKQEQEDTRAYNTKMWNMQNAYNSPYAQMQRYQAAGLNPNLMYGSGSASSGNAGPVSPVSPVSYRAPEIDLSQSVGLLQAYQDYIKNKEVTETAKYQTGLAKEAYIKSRLENFYAFENKASSPSFSFANGLGKFGWVQPIANNKEQEPLYLQQKRADLLSTNLSNTLRSQESQLKGNLLPFNMTSTDSIWARLLIRAFGSQDSNLENSPMANINNNLKEKFRGTPFVYETTTP